jgi:hypothetical protein
MNNNENNEQVLETNDAITEESVKISRGALYGAPVEIDGDLADLEKFTLNKFYCIR